MDTNLDMYSDDSDDTSEEVDVYRKKYRLITERCEVIQQVIFLVLPNNLNMTIN